MTSLPAHPQAAAAAFALCRDDQSRHGRLEAREAEMIRAAETAARAVGVAFSAFEAAALEVSLSASRADQSWNACRRSRVAGAG